MDLKTQLDLINPYYSKLRQWIWEQLIMAFPTNAIVLYSHVPSTAPQFEAWTGSSQRSLVNRWTTVEGFRLNTSTDPKEKARGVYIRDHPGPVTTTCEGLVNVVLQKMRRSGLAGNIQSIPDKLTSFNIAGLGQNGKEPATTPGWHWATELSEKVRPLAGDLFQAGSKSPFGDQWSLKHVGVVLDFQYNGGNPIWSSVEAGQGGPAAGCDMVKRLGPRPLNPMSRFDNRVFMGWLNIDEYFASKLPQPPKPGTAAAGSSS